MNMTQGSIIIKTVDTWDDYLSLVGSEQFRYWAFRGQQDEAWQLWPTITRELRNRKVNPKFWTDQEHRIIWIFQRKAAHYLEKVPEIKDVFQWMALMKHHGAPTRLLDFTWSPYVAAFFALESSTKDAAVWAINAPEIGSQCFRADKWDDDWVPSPQEGLRRYQIDTLDSVGIGEPFLKNQRLIAQSGTFACPYDIEFPIEEILSRRQNTIAKFVLKHSTFRKRALSELYAMNVTHATLFPDLDGLARSLRNELEIHWRYDPTA
jgi:hypothetical protein